MNAMPFRTAADLMTREVYTASLDWTLSQLSEFFTDHDISGAPVVDDNGVLVGTITLRDVVRYLGLHHREVPVHARPEVAVRPLYGAYNPEDLADLHLTEVADEPTVRDLFTPAVYSVPEETPLDAVAESMRRGGIHRLFVNRGTELVGVISAVDLLRALGNPDVPFARHTTPEPWVSFQAWG